MGGKLTQKNGRRMAGGKPIPKSSFALPSANGGAGAYPIDTANRARNALARVAQNGSPQEKATVQAAVKRKYAKQINVGGGNQDMSNAHGHVLDFASVSHSVTHTHDGSTHTHDFDHDGDNDFAGGGVGGTQMQSTGATPQPNNFKGATGVRPQTVRGGSGGSGAVKGFANDGIELARRLPVRTGDDVIVSRVPGGGVVIRHRAGGQEIGQLKYNGDGTVSAVLDGKTLQPHRMERSAIQEMLSTYNTTTTTAERPAMPLQQPPVQPELFSQLGVANIRAFASDGDADDTSGGGSGGGLSPRGQGIYKKLIAKKVSPKVAMAMAKRAENTTPGHFGKA